MVTSRTLAWACVACMAAWCAASYAQDDCDTCGGTTFPAAAAFLATKGFAPDEFTVLLSWREAARNAPGVIVTGHHVAPRTGRDTFDLYSDADGRLLGAAEQVVLGIRSKNWDLAPVEQQTEIPPALAASLPERPTPVGVAHRVAPSASVRLEPPDQAALEAEDEAALEAGKGANRVGVVRPLPQPILVIEDAASPGAWRTLSDGSRLWAATVASPGAHAIRLCLSELEMPAGARVVVYNAYGPLEAYGPYERFYGNDQELWTASCFSDAVTVECYVPAAVNAAGLKLVIEDLAHTYVGLESMPWGKAAGSCNLDVTCFPEWDLVSRGVAGFTLVAGSNQLHCTGTLIADSDPETDTPYFLTANHCVSSQYSASSMEFLWLYQSDECDGLPPSLSDVPRTPGGADYLAGINNTSGNDFTLVRLRNTPPAGIPYVGWTTLPVVAGDAVTCIHHPSKDFKRISFGHAVDTGSPIEGGYPLKPYEDYIESLWDRIDRGDAMDGGTTEHGSSGGPLLLADGQLIVGQLYGGYASCYQSEEPDYYGRFEKTLPLVEQWLAPSWDPIDVDKSGAVNAVDVQLVVNALLGLPIGYNADVDGSGRLDAVDLQLVILAVLYGGD